MKREKGKGYPFTEKANKRHILEYKYKLMSNPTASSSEQYTEDPELPHTAGMQSPSPQPTPAHPKKEKRNRKITLIALTVEARFRCFASQKAESGSAPKE